VTIVGFLARDFKRDATLGVLRPAPRVYTNSRRDHGPRHRDGEDLKAMVEGRLAYVKTASVEGL